MKRPVVSVIIPCFNSGEFIAKAVESALEQTCKDLEVIIVDDGSTEKQTVDVLNNSRWERTRILRQENKGPAAARNIGIRTAKGEFILPLDADDYIDPTYVEKALAVMRSHPGVGIVYCKAMRFGIENGPWELPPYSLDRMVFDNIIFCTALYRKSDWEKVGGYTETLRHGVEDYEFWIKLLSKDIEVHQIDEYLFHYYVQKKSRTTKFSSDRESMIAAYAEIFRNNSDFFVKHADAIYRYRFELLSELKIFSKYLKKVDKYLSKIPWLHALAKSIFLRMGE